MCIRDSGDPVSGLNAVGVLLAALRQKLKQGIGQHIDIALAASPVCNLGEYFVSESVNLHTAKLDGNKHESMTPHGVYQTKTDDQWVAIAIESTDQWNSLVKIIDSDKLKSPSYKDFFVRKKKETEIDNVIFIWTKKWEGEHIMGTLQASGIPTGIVSNSKQMLEDPH